MKPIKNMKQDRLTEMDDSHLLVEKMKFSFTIHKGISYRRIRLLAPVSGDDFHVLFKA